jgi:hypothetical protein
MRKPLRAVPFLEPFQFPEGGSRPQTPGDITQMKRKK